MSLATLLAPQNLLFELPFVAALLYAVLMATGGIGDGHDGDADADLDHDLDVDHDVELDQEVGLDAVHAVDHDVDHDLDHDNDHDIEDGGDGLLRVLSFFGFGKVPISILMMSFCFIWGFTGWASNLILSGFLPPAIYILPSVGIALFCSLTLTKYIATGLAKLMPKTENYAVATANLVGREGVLIYDTSATFGEVRVYDVNGAEHRVRCRVREDAQPLLQGTKVVLAQYVDESGFFYVETLDEFDERLLRATARRYRQ